MKKKMKLIQPNDFVAAAVELAEILRRPGAVVLVPTETVYGLIARASDEEAIKRIYGLKGRQFDKPLGWFVGDWKKLPEYGVNITGLPEKLAAEYCPGALTIIAPRTDGSTQGFRVPDTPLLAALLREIGEPLVQTSANASGMPDAADCEGALLQLNGEVDCAVDGGKIDGVISGSTVVDACGEKIKILRQGKLDLQKWL
jgi:L-threonylcarbamoyladenylate synthase